MTTVDAFTDDPRLLDAFVELPYRLHRGDKVWIPPLRETLRAQLSDANPWFGHGRLSHFMARAGGEVVARATAFVDDQLQEDGRPVGLIGLFESVDDAGVAGAVIAAARAWLAEQGAAGVLAPVNFSMWFGYRFRTSAHDTPAYFGEPQNPAYYPALFEQHGFEAAKEYITSRLDTDTQREQREKYRSAYELAESNGYSFRPFDVRNFERDLRLLHSLLVPHFREFVGWTDLSYEEFAFEYAALGQVIDPKVLVFAVDAAGEAVGYLVAFPDVGDALRAMRGHASLLSKLRFVWMRRRVDRVIMADIGLVPEVRGLGLGSALNYAILDAVHANPRYAEVLVGISALDNVSVKYGGGSDELRHYRLYRART